MRLFLFLLPVLAFSTPRADYVIAQVKDAEIWDVKPTGSMSPAFDETDWLLAVQTSWDQLKIGDIIIYERKDGEYVVHRIWAISSGGSVILTKGDANSEPDSEYVTKSMYRGRVIGQIKRPIEVDKVGKGNQS